MSADPWTQIAAELYAVPPAGFIAARNARAAATADRDLAAQIRALRKPSVAAWVVNVFAHERAAELALALQLVGRLREAQHDLDAASLADLGRRRRVLTDRLVHDAVMLAEARGGRVTSATAEAVTDTIRAAFFEPDAAAAVGSGRLVRELRPAGGLTVDLTAAVGGPPPESAPPAPVDDVTARPARDERAVRTAERAVAAARREFDRVDRDVVGAAARVERLTRREHDLRAELVLVQESLVQAHAQHTRLDGQRTAAAETLAAAERDRARARDAHAADSAAP